MNRNLLYTACLGFTIAISACSEAIEPEASQQTTINKEVVSTIQNADGSSVTTYKDGSTLTTLTDGSTVLVDKTSNMITTTTAAGEKTTTPLSSVTANVSSNNILSSVVAKSSVQISSSLTPSSIIPISSAIAPSSATVTYPSSKITLVKTYNNLVNGFVNFGAQNIVSNAFLKEELVVIQPKNTTITTILSADGTTEGNTYQARLEGVELGESYTIDIDSVKPLVRLARKVEVEENPKQTYLYYLSTTHGHDIKSDMYTVRLKEKETNRSFSVEDSKEETALFYFSQGTDFLALIQFENNSYQKKDTLYSKDSYFRLRPTPSLQSNDGAKLYFYNQSLTLIDSLSSVGSNGSGSGTYSYQFSGTNGADKLGLNNGEYKIRFKGQTKTSPFIEIYFHNGASTSNEIEELK